MFSKILIANRGEIAVRIIRACKEMGIKTVAVHSRVDRNSLHVRWADESICIGAAESIGSYLHVPSIISAAEITDAEAIHPGYGFLAENPAFAEICEACGLVFIGPKAEHIRMMGDKSMAKETMAKAGVPILLGSSGAVKDESSATAIAEEIGFPVIIKASAGGGGRGMRIVQNKESLANSFMTAQSEAAAAFGSSEVYIEKYIEEPRHIEIQILADSHGKTIHLGERDCSIQRRHQKLLEESPSPVVDSKLRLKMGQAAVKGVQSAGYINAGTVEFLVDKDGKYYFMEMNTRIQVEHPVTEMVTGIDLIKEQIKIAAGDKLSYCQKDIKLSGSAIECRINAEDPFNFTPNPGKITNFHPPGGPGVRVDTHIYDQYLIPPFYDSLIGKLIVHANSRDEALGRMKRALEEFVIEGVKTTIPFHIKLLNDPRFIKGEVSTSFIEKFFSIQ